MKRYLPEPESEELATELEGRGDLIVSDLGFTEIVSAFARRRREGAVSPEALGRLHRAVLADLDAQLFTTLELTRETHRAAERLLVSAASVPLRAADALHLALAVDGGARSLATFDQHQRDAARAVGVLTYP